MDFIQSLFDALQFVTKNPQINPEQLYARGIGAWFSGGTE